MKEKLYKFLQSFNLQYKKNILVDRIKKGSNVLDYGCGAGEFVKYIENDFHTFGFEPNSDARNAAINKTQKAKIIDDLNYDKEKFENIIYTFDDDYDMLKEFISKLNPVLKSHSELLKISENILTNLIKAQNEISIIISQNEYKKI